MESKQSCGVCAKVVGEHPEAGIQVSCDGPCGKAFHLLCADLSMPLFYARAAKAGLLWFCKLCRVEFDEGVRHRESALQTAMREMFEEVRYSIREMASRVDAIDDVLRVGRAVGPAIKSEKSTQFEDVTLSISKEPADNRVDRFAFCTNDKESAKVQAVQAKTASKLSAKIWKKVFEYLSFEDLCQIRLVNRQWMKICDSERSLMDKFVSKFPENIVIDREFKSIPMLPASTVLFKKATIIVVGSWWSQRITETLVHLAFSDCKITLVNLMEMLRNLPNLGSLILSCKSTLTYTPAVEKYSDLRLEKIKSLTLDDQMQTEVLKVLLRMCPGLLHLELSQELSKEHLNVINTMNNLEGISLQGGSDVLVEMKQPLKKISLTLTNSWCGINENMINFSKSQTLLKNLDLNVLGSTIAVVYIYHLHGFEPREGFSLDNETLAQVFQNLNLKRLSLRMRRVGRRDNSALIDLKHILNELTELEFLAFDGVNEQSISFSEATSTHLKELHLSNIDGTSMQEYIQGSKDLRTITLIDCKLGSWLDLFAPSQVKELRHLKLIRVQTRFSCDLLEYFDQLRYLEMINCEMSAELLSIFFRLCPRMEELILSEMNHVSDAVVLLLCQKMPKLRKLTLHKCPITDESLGHIAEHGRNLRYLTITACGGLSADAKAQLDKARFFVLKIE